MLEEEKRISTEIARLSKRDSANKTLPRIDLLETGSARDRFRDDRRPLLPTAAGTSERYARKRREECFAGNSHPSGGSHHSRSKRHSPAPFRTRATPDRPIGSFLFLGPTGVGKTLIAKTVAESFFGGREHLIRLDMSEFMERHSVAQMIGAPAGYVGYGDGGKLTERVRRTPHAVILFDEIEKAHPDVFNILLQILDDGRLTDAEGRSVSFRHALIILTSNIGTEAFTRQARIGFGRDTSAASPGTVKDEVLAELKKALRPELLARIDHTVIMNALGRDAVEKIARLELSALRTRLGKMGVSLSVPAPVTRLIVEKSFAPEHGARLVRKHIDGFVEHAIARTLLKGNPAPKRNITLSVENDVVVCKETAPKKTRKRK
jgi:ATP-dependent Clp protease ATP-binding subunit ClpA